MLSSLGSNSNNYALLWLDNLSYSSFLDINERNLRVCRWQRDRIEKYDAKTGLCTMERRVRIKNNTKWSEAQKYQQSVDNLVRTILLSNDYAVSNPSAIERWKGFIENR